MKDVRYTRCNDGHIEPAIPGTGCPNTVFVPGLTGHFAKAVLGVVAIGLCLVGAVPGSGFPATAAATAAVPAKYQTAFDQTRSDLDAYTRTIDAMPSYASKPTGSHFGFVELLDANGNRQSALLKPGVMTGIDQSLDAFKHLGVGGVVVGVKLPLLLSQYTSQASQYTRFFAHVANAARARGFVIDVELGALFCGTIYADCSYTYPTSVAGWASLTAQQARTVINTMHPDYLDLISEPNTEAILTKIKDLQTLDGFRSFVSDALTDIGGHGTTKLMAGAASWFPASYDLAIIHSGIDGLITHVYPATAKTAANLVATSRVAHDAGKPIIADEVWLYKGQTTASGSVQASNEQGALNCFSFWQPLDVQFIRATRQWAQKAGSPLMSGFWSWEAFAYTPWTPTLDAQSSQQIQSKNYTAAQTALTAGLFTATGRAIVGR